MVLDTDAYIALGFVVMLLVITGGLAWFVINKINR